jgi:hypothetical protein
MTEKWEVLVRITGMLLNPMTMECLGFIKDDVAVKCVKRDGRLVVIECPEDGDHGADCDGCQGDRAVGDSYRVYWWTHFRGAPGCVLITDEWDD